MKVADPLQRWEIDWKTILGEEDTRGISVKKIQEGDTRRRYKKKIQDTRRYLKKFVEESSNKIRRG